MPTNVRGFFKDLKVEYITKNTRGPQLTTSILGWRCALRSHFHVYLVINVSELCRVRSLSTVSRNVQGDHILSSLGHCYSEGLFPGFLSFRVYSFAGMVSTVLIIYSIDKG